MTTRAFITGYGTVTPRDTGGGVIGFAIQIPAIYYVRSDGNNATVTSQEAVLVFNASARQIMGAVVDVAVAQAPSGFTVADHDVTVVVLG